MYTVEEAPCEQQSGNQIVIYDETQHQGQNEQINQVLASETCGVSVHAPEAPVFGAQHGQQLVQNNLSVQNIVIQSQQAQQEALTAVAHLRGGVQEQIHELIQHLLHRFHEDDQSRMAQNATTDSVVQRLNRWGDDLDTLVAKVQHIESVAEQNKSTCEHQKAQHSNVAARVKAIENRLKGVEDKQQRLETLVTESRGAVEKMCKDVEQHKQCSKQTAKEWKAKFAALEDFPNEWPTMRGELDTLHERTAKAEASVEALYDLHLAQQKVVQAAASDGGDSISDRGDSSSEVSEGADMLAELNEAVQQLPVAGEEQAEAARQVRPTPPPPAKPTTSRTPAPTLGAPVTGGWRKPRTRRKQPTPRPLPMSQCVFVGNQRLSGGKWVFKSSSGDWRTTLQRQLGGNAYLLQGVQQVAQTVDTRLCLRATSQTARRALLAALRGVKSVRCYPCLTELERANKSACYKFAQEMGIRVVDRGDLCGLCGKREATPLRLQLAPLDLPTPAFRQRLHRLLELADRRASPRQPAPPPPRASRPSAGPVCRQGQPKQALSRQLPTPPTMHHPRYPTPPPPTAWMHTPPAVYTPPTQPGGPWRQLPHAQAAAFPGGYGAWQTPYMP